MITEKERNQLRSFVQHARESKHGFVQLLIFQEEMKLKRPLNQFEVLNLLDNRCVCPRCERFALRNKDWTEEKPFATCENCGYDGPAKTVRDYIEDEDFK